jgi:hypothetical protein
MKPQAQPPFDHQIRRRILRRLNEVDGPYVADRLSEDLKLKLNEIRYHARVLARWRTVKERRAGACHATVRYESLVADDPDVIALLNSTETQDEPQAPGDADPLAD